MNQLQNNCSQFGDNNQLSPNSMMSNTFSNYLNQQQVQHTYSTQINTNYDFTNIS